MVYESGLPGCASGALGQPSKQETGLSVAERRHWPPAEFRLSGGSSPGEGIRDAR